MNVEFGTKFIENMKSSYHADNKSVLIDVNSCTNEGSSYKDCN